MTSSVIMIFEPSLDERSVTRGKCGNCCMRDVDEDGEVLTAENTQLNFVSDPRAVCCRYFSFWFFVDLGTSFPLNSQLRSCS